MNLYTSVETNALLPAYVSPDIRSTGGKAGLHNPLPYVVCIRPKPGEKEKVKKFGTRRGLFHVCS